MSHVMVQHVNCSEIHPQTVDTQLLLSLYFQSVPHERGLLRQE